MTKFRQQKGFTLVELAIVLTIIGLLIGGVLKGRQLIQNSRVTATIAQVNAIAAATTAFKDTYNATPGDMPDASTRIPNCSQCIPLTSGDPDTVSAGGIAGDGAVGATNWNMARAQGATAVAPNSSVDNETLYFWAELGQAGLISGVSYNGAPIGGGAATFGTHAPAAKVGGGLIVGYASGVVDQPLAVPPAAAGRARLSGLVLALVPSPSVNLATTTGTQPLDASTAAQIDRKTDDGAPITGDTQVYGYNTGNTAAGCFGLPLTVTVSTVEAYNEAITAKDCGLFFKING